MIWYTVTDARDWECRANCRAFAAQLGRKGCTVEAPDGARWAWARGGWQRVMELARPAPRGEREERDDG